MREPREGLEHCLAHHLQVSRRVTAGFSFCTQSNIAVWQKSYCKTKCIFINTEGVPLITSDIMHVWRMCTGLFKGLQNVLILKYLHRAARGTHSCTHHTVAVLCQEYTHQQSQDKWTVCWVCSGTELKKIPINRAIQTWILKIKPALYSSLGYSSTSQIHSWCDFSFFFEQGLHPSNPWTVQSQLGTEETSGRRMKSRELPLTFPWFSVGWLVINFFIIKNLQKPPHCGTHYYNTFISETSLSLQNS